MANRSLRNFTPAFLRPDNGPKFVQSALQEWLPTQGVQTLTIELGSPWQNRKSEIEKASRCTVNCATSVWIANSLTPEPKRAVWSKTTACISTVKDRIPLSTTNLQRSSFKAGNSINLSQFRLHEKRPICCY